MEKSTILITDDSKFNREILEGILGSGYNYVFASDGVELVELLGGDTNPDLILLDINMPNMDGFEVLEIMNKRRWIEEIPVIVISAESDAAFIRRAYKLGAIDYITRPFNTYAVQHRTRNTLMLYSKQRRLVQLVEDQVYEREKTNDYMIGILSHVIETRNSESGAHILNIRTVTSMLLHRLVKVTDRYMLTENDISLISALSALHDIGKMVIPKKILNKPGKLTDKEWEIMKTHTVRGDELLKGSPVPKGEPIMQTAHAICRWHHERWDGKGYPDGLRGDDIPISAQAVSIADVYDALTSERCYKAAYSHDEAIEMILGGECGAFNPVLLSCLEDISAALKEKLYSSTPEFDYASEAKQLADEMLSVKSLPIDDRTKRLISNERTRKEFFAKLAGGIQFEYDKMLGKITYVNHYDEENIGKRTFYLSDGADTVKLLDKKDWNKLKDRLSQTTPENPEITLNALINRGGEYRWHRITARTVWPARGGEYIGALGHFRDIHDDVTRQGFATLILDAAVSSGIFNTLRDMFGIVRLVDPESSSVFEPDKNGKLIKTPVRCYELWGRNDCCENCSSKRALKQKNWIGKLEISDGKMYSVLSKYVKTGDKDCVLEIAFRMDDDTDSKPVVSVPERTNFLMLNFYRDALTKAYSRMYLEDFMANLENSDGIAVIDVDDFKRINDTYGHQIGDVALKLVAETILGSVGSTDTLIRYGGDEFLLIFAQISETAFYRKLSEIREKISRLPFKDCKGLTLSVSVGGAYRVRPLQEAIAAADKAMYKNKTENKGEK